MGLKIKSSFVKNCQGNQKFLKSMERLYSFRFWEGIVLYVTSLFVTSLFILSLSNKQLVTCMYSYRYKQGKFHFRYATLSDVALPPNDEFRKSQHLCLVPALRWKTFVLLPLSITSAVGFVFVFFVFFTDFLFQVVGVCFCYFFASIFTRTRCNFLKHSFHLLRCFWYDFSFLTCNLVNTLFYFL